MCLWKIDSVHWVLLCVPLHISYIGSFNKNFYFYDLLCVPFIKYDVFQILFPWSFLEWPLYIPDSDCEAWTLEIHSIYLHKYVRLDNPFSSFMCCFTYFQDTKHPQKIIEVILWWYVMYSFIKYVSCFFIMLCRWVWTRRSTSNVRSANAGVQEIIHGATGLRGPLVTLIFRI